MNELQNVELFICSIDMSDQLKQISETDKYRSQECCPIKSSVSLIDFT